MQSTVLELVERALSGVDITDADLAAADWESLSEPARENAMSVLQHWMGDAPARLRDPYYAAVQAAGLRIVMHTLIRDAC